MNDTREPTVPAWFMKAIASGLQSLYALCLEGTPGADVFPATTRVWAFDLWEDRRRFWHEEADLPCIQKAFAGMRSSCSRWPSQAKFWDCLPNRAEPKVKTIGPGWGREREADALRCMDRWLADLGIDRWGNPL